MVVDSRLIVEQGKVHVVVTVVFFIVTKTG